MSRFCTLCSSSSGNSTYIGHTGGGILIDAGTNAKQLTLALEKISVDPASLKAIFITHEHADHIGALRVFASRYNIPVYASGGTLRALEKAGHLRGEFAIHEMTGKGTEVCGMNITDIVTSHDSAESRGYTVEMPDERKISVITDTGIITQDIIDKATGSDLILLESNHDKEMLNNGPYPYHLKQRILSDKGHLSNEDCAKAARHFVNTGTSRLILGHLSRENNTATAAYNTTNNELGKMGAIQGMDYILQVAPACVGERMVIL